MIQLNIFQSHHHALVTNIHERRASVVIKVSSAGKPGIEFSVL